MEAYYDEEIAWGPLTLDEVKEELQKTPTKLQRSCSDMSRYSLRRKSEDPSKIFEDLKESREVERRGSSLLSELNDTVKEMELALLHGLDYDMSEDKNKKKKPEGGAEVFKVPAPVKRKNFSKSFKNKYEHVVSPVGLYIKSGDYRDDNKENMCSVNCKKLFHKTKQKF